MKVVILAGGFGTRIGEETHIRPKPMVEIGARPILWHIMKIYSSYGFNEFVICCGYKGYVIKEYFSNYFMHCSDITFDFSANNEIIIHNNIAEPWKVTLVDTGLETMTGGRLKRVEPYLENQTFMLTYGDGVSDVNIKKLYDYHLENNKTVTLTAFQPGSRFGTLDLSDDCSINSFAEKSKEVGGWINAGFMVCEPELISYIKDDSTILEREPLETLAAKKELQAYCHDGFWQCMDTVRDKKLLEELWETGEAPWRIW